MSKYTIGLLVRNRYGVLSRVSSMFSRRGFNIDSLTVGETADSSISRMTITLSGNSHDRDQIIKQLAKLHEVIKVKDMSDGEVVSRELVIIKVRADREARQEILNAANVFRAKVVDYSPHSMMLEITGTGDKINALVEILKDYGLLEIARTGIVAVERGGNDPD
ncbi:MAG: acetolactate synthase small subunit [Lachnospiraceae bacterium]|nr:acetolactate synthase small subunit [Lachnospiraceae bacterium]